MNHNITGHLLAALVLLLAAVIPLNAQGPSGCPPGLTHYWKLDDVGQPYDDYYGINDATCTVCPTPVAGTVGGAQQFAGAQKVYVADDDSYDWGPMQSFSLELWMRKSVAGTGTEVMVGRYQSTPTTMYWWLGVDGTAPHVGQVSFRMLSGTTSLQVWSTTVVTDNNWHHVAVVRDGTTGTTTIYIDGTQEGSGTQAFTTGFASAVSMNIGWFNLAPFYYFNGILDEVATYDVALTPTKIANHHNSGLIGKGYCEEFQAPYITSVPITKGMLGQAYTYDVGATGVPAPTYSLVVSPTGMGIDEITGVISWVPMRTGPYNVAVAATNIEGQDIQLFTIDVVASTICPPKMSHLWKLDEITGQPYHDYNGTDATCSNCPIPTSGRVSGAQLFDSNDSVNVADDGSYDWAANASFSIEFWMQKDSPCSSSSTNSNEVIVGRYDGPTHFWWLGVNCDASTPQGAILFRTKDGSGSVVDVHGKTAVTDGSWHHIAVVRDSSTLPNGTTRIYVDGVVQDSAIHAYASGFTSPLELNIGHYNLSPGYHYRGVLDELAFYNGALTEAEVLDNYNRGQSGVSYCSICGDADGSGNVDISDAVYLIAYIFSGGSAPSPLLAGDTNCDGLNDISDVVYLIAYIFAGGLAPCATCN